MVQGALQPTLTQFKMVTTLTPTVDVRTAGFTLKFDNGYQLLIGYGLSHDTDNKMVDLDTVQGVDYLKIPETSTVEITVLGPDGKHAWVEGGVVGKIPVDAIPQLMVSLDMGEELMFMSILGMISDTEPPAEVAVEEEPNSGVMDV
jgi:hypothetical protein